MYCMEVAVMSHSAGGRNTSGLKVLGLVKGSCAGSAPAALSALRRRHRSRKKAAMHMVSPRNMPHACRKGWSKPRTLPSVDSEVMVSAHLTESVLMEPVTSMRPARPRWNQFMAEEDEVGTLARTKTSETPPELEGASSCTTVGVFLVLGVCR